MQLKNDKANLIKKSQKISLLVKTVNNCTRTQKFSAPAFNDWDVIAMISEFLMANNGKYVRHIMTEKYVPDSKGKYGKSEHYIDLKWIEG